MSIRLVRLEAWALETVSRVQSGKRTEDSRIELKREWPDHEKAARRIAGQSNSCFGSDVLWIIGLDEDAGVVGAEPEELANWWSAVCAQFDGVAPSLTDIVLTVNGQSLVCLLFETSRPPYVVRNPKFGLPAGGSVAWEVPWREGTSVRTATRNDLVRMLVPTIGRPEIEVLGGGGRLAQKSASYLGDELTGIRLSFNLSIYVYPRGDETVVIPFHRCQCLLADRDRKNVIEEFAFTMYGPHSFSADGSRPDTVTIERTSNELIAKGPGTCSISVEVMLNHEPDWLNASKIFLRIILFIVSSELPVEFEVSLQPEEPRNNEIQRWSVESHG